MIAVHLFFRKYRSTAPRKSRTGCHSVSPRHSHTHSATTARQPLVFPAFLSSHSCDWRALCANSRLRRLTGSGPQVLSQIKEHIWNHRSKPDPVICISSQSVMVTWRSSFISLTITAYLTIKCVASSFVSIGLVYYMYLTGT